MKIKMHIWLKSLTPLCSPNFRKKLTVFLLKETQFNRLISIGEFSCAKH